MSGIAVSDGNPTTRMEFFAAKGTQASRLRRRKYTLARRFGLPADILGGSLVLSHRRCGKPTCWCADSDGHPQWTLTYSVDGTKQVENIPEDRVDDLMPLVEEGQSYRKAVIELRAITPPDREGCLGLIAKRRLAFGGRAASRQA